MVKDKREYTLKSAKWDSLPSCRAEGDPGRRSGERLARYVAIDGGDEVVRYLDIFINHLPEDGSITLMQDIIGLDDDQLRQLSHHLADAILKPVKASGAKAPAAAQSPCSGT
ncbi:hypothetical protein MaudCBS49596_005238 [Microsporum audouinii]